MAWESASTSSTSVPRKASALTHGSSLQTWLQGSLVADAASEHHRLGKDQRHGAVLLFLKAGQGGDAGSGDCWRLFYLRPLRSKQLSLGPEGLPEAAAGAIPKSPKPAQHLLPISRMPAKPLWGALQGSPEAETTMDWLRAG